MLVRPRNRVERRGYTRAMSLPTIGLLVLSAAAPPSLPVLVEELVRETAEVRSAAGSRAWTSSTRASAS